MNMIMDVSHEGSHECDPLKESNSKRLEEKESLVYIFADFYGEWNMRVGLEFVVINFCPFCGE